MMVKDLIEELKKYPLDTEVKKAMKIEEENVLLCKLFKRYVDKLKDSVSKALNSEIGGYKGYHDSFTNGKHYDNAIVLNRVLSQICLDTDIDNNTLFNSRLRLEEFKDYNEHLCEIKNTITDIMCPQKERGTREYHNNMLKAGRLADFLENLLYQTYKDGLNTGLLFNSNTIGEDEENFLKKQNEILERDLNESYHAGTELLMSVLKGAINGDENCEELLNTKNKILW